jgi:uncharacterized membrane protein YdjX (TVP38/TMEM64 family)
MNGTNGKSEPGATKRAVPWKWIGLAVVIIALCTAVRVLPITDWLARFNYGVADLGIWGVLLFILVYILAAVLFFPASILTIGAGFIFGLLLGTAIVSIAATAGAALAFLIARYLARDQIERQVANNSRFKRIDRAIGERGAKLIFLLRLSPLIPFNISNYFFGLTAVSFWPYVLASWIGMLPGILLYVYLGAAGKAGLSGAVGQPSGRSPWEYVFFGVGLIATLVVTFWVTRIARRELSKTDNEGALLVTPEKHES